MERPRATAPLLVLGDVHVLYDGSIVGLHGVSLEVPDRSVVALLGPNGAGKSTTLKAASGILGAERGRVTRGTVSYRGERIGARSPSRLVQEGLVQVLEGRHCFPHLTVEENLATGAFARAPAGRDLREGIERVLARFPALKERRRSAAGHLSGGEQQMLAIGRALMARPALVLLDEPSMGLAPKIVQEVFALVRQLHEEEGVSFLLAEQNAAAALAVADTAYVLENGHVIAEGTAAAVRARGDVEELYLGRGSAGRTRFRSRGASAARPQGPAAITDAAARPQGTAAISDAVESR
jgi:branched-chain amino acid transport system ATP-binding protein